MAVCIFIALATAAEPTASMECGLVAGRRAENGVRVFSGIPYAAPPTHARRWRPPAAGLCWSDTLDATSFGAACPQSPGSMDVGRTSEDCLFLNVWTPTGDTAHSAPAPLKPVMLWIHGGGFVFGSGNYPNYAPTADQARAMDAVLVSINYRLGPLGWLATSELSLDNADSLTSGNYGLMDMIAALRWVQRNIRSFGGDPAAVTLYGQSAGGTATMALMAAPAARGLFHRALMQSGSARFNTTLREAERDNAYFIERAGCGGRASPAAGVACLRAASTATLMNATRWDVYPGWGGGGVSGFPVLNFSWGNLAIVDGTVLPSAPVDAIASGDPRRASIVPLVVGSTAQETDLFPIRPSIRNTSQHAYDALARRAMAPFGAGACFKTTVTFHADPPSHSIRISMVT